MIAGDRARACPLDGLFCYRSELTCGAGRRGNSMHRNRRWGVTCATLALAGMVQPRAAAVAQPGDDVTIEPQSSDMVWQYARDPAQEPPLSPTEKLRLL